MPLHQRRSIRLPGYDYTQPGAYFVTVCTQGRQPLFGTLHGDTIQLNEAGRMVEQWWHALNEKFPSMHTDAWVVMPDHFHGIVVIGDGGVNNDGNSGDPGDSNAVGANPRVRPQRNDNAVGANPRVRPQRNDNAVGANPRVRPQRNDNAVGANPRVRPQRHHDDFDEGRHAGLPLHGDSGDSDDPDDPNAVGANPHVRPQRHHDDPDDSGDSNADGANQYVRPIENNDHLSLSQILQWFKTMTTNAYIRGVRQCAWPSFERRVWQRGYWERIVRNDQELQAIRRYVAGNPQHHARRLDNLLARMQRKDTR